MTGQTDFEGRLRQQIDAYHEAALVYAAVKLGLPDRLAQKPATAEELAAALELSAPHFRRFLRGLCSIGIFEEGPDGAFALTAAGQSLRPGAPARLAEKVQIVVGQYWWPWSNFISNLRGGKPAFEQCFGMPVSDWRAKHAEQGALFDSYLAKETGAQMSGIVAALDLTGVKTIAVLLAQPQLAEEFDKKRMVELSEPFRRLLDVAKRVEFVPGNLLEAVPVQADLYLLIGVLQTYDNKDAATILRHCGAAMPERARLVLIERPLPERPEDDPAAIMLDLHMMTITGGRLRSPAEIEKLLADVGLRPTRATPTPSGLTLIEVARSF